MDIKTRYVLGWKSIRVYNSKLEPLYIAFLHSIKLFGYEMVIKFDKNPLSVEQKKKILDQKLQMFTRFMI